MDDVKRKRLEAQGWRVGSTQNFLELNEEETAYIELKLALGKSLKECRLQKKLTQTELARRIRSNQSRIAKMEAGHPSVSIDLLVKSLLALGTTRQGLASMISQE